MPRYIYGVVAQAVLALLLANLSLATYVDSISLKDILPSLLDSATADLGKPELVIKSSNPISPNFDAAIKEYFSELGKELELPLSLKQALSANSSPAFSDLEGLLKTVAKNGGEKTQILESMLSSPSALNKESAKQIEELMRVVLSSRLNTLYDSIDGAVSFLKNGLDAYRALGVEELLQKLESKTGGGNNLESRILETEPKRLMIETGHRVRIVPSAISPQVLQSQLDKIGEASTELLGVVNKLIRANGLETLEIVVSRALESIPEPSNSDESGAKLLLQRIKEVVAKPEVDGSIEKSVERELKQALAELGAKFAPETEVSTQSQKTLGKTTIEHLQRTIDSAFKHYEKLMSEERERAISVLRDSVGRANLQLVETLAIKDASKALSLSEREVFTRDAVMRTAQEVQNKGESSRSDVETRYKPKDLAFEMMSREPSREILKSINEAGRVLRQTIDLQTRALQLLESVQGLRNDDSSSGFQEKVIELRKPLVMALRQIVNKPNEKISEEDLQQFFPKEAVKVVGKLLNVESQRVPALRNDIARALSELVEQEFPQVEKVAAVIDEVAKKIGKMISSTQSAQRVEDVLRQSLTQISEVSANASSADPLSDSSDISRAYQRAIKNVEKQLQTVITNREAFFESNESRERLVQTVELQLKTVNKLFEGDTPIRELKPLFSESSAELSRIFTALRSQQTTQEIFTKIDVATKGIEQSVANIYERLSLDLAVQDSAFEEKTHASKRVQFDISVERLKQGLGRLKEGLREVAKPLPREVVDSVDGERPFLEFRRTLEQLETISKLAKEVAPSESRKLSEELRLLTESINAKSIPSEIHETLNSGAKRLEQALQNLIESVVARTNTSAVMQGNNLNEFVEQLRTSLDSLRQMRNQLDEVHSSPQRAEFAASMQDHFLDSLMELMRQFVDANRGRRDVFSNLIDRIHADLARIKTQGKSEGVLDFSVQKYTELFERNVADFASTTSQRDSLAADLSSPDARAFLGRVDRLVDTAGQALEDHYKPLAGSSSALINEVFMRLERVMSEQSRSLPAGQMPLGVELLKELSSSIAAAEKRTSSFSLEHEAKLLDAAKQLVAREGFAKELGSDVETQELVKQLVTALGRRTSASTVSSELPRDISQDLQLLQKLEGMLRGQEFLNQLNPVMSSLGEPAFILFPLLMNGFLSRVEMMFYPTFPHGNSGKGDSRGMSDDEDDVRKVPEIDEKDSGEQRDSKQRKKREHLVFSINLPSLGQVEVSFKDELDKLILSFRVEKEEAAVFLEDRLAGLVPLMSELGFRNIKLGVELANLGSLRPAWVKVLEDSSLCTV